ncbi:MAG TPA: hypothetical protein PKV71_04165 [Calditrichia bacterium]|nr:hypothetical protein [Calditrichia bacterium]
MPPKLKIGLLVNSCALPAWEYRMVEIIAESSYAEICLIIESENDETPQSKFWQKLKDHYPHLLYLLWKKAEGIWKTVEPDPFESKTLEDILPNVQLLKVKPIRKKFSDYLQSSDIEKIRQHEPDVLLRLGFRILRGEILSVAKLGVWSYHHGDNRVNRGGPAGFWEVLEGWGTTGSVLQILTEDLDGGEVLYRSWSQTDILLVNRNRGKVFWKSLSFLPRKLEELHRLGVKRFREKLSAENQHPEFYSRRLYQNPSNGEFTRILVRHYYRYLKLKVYDFFWLKQWVLLYRFSPHKRISTSFWRFKTILPPKDRFWADPFIVQRDGKYYVFLEEFLYENKKGHIAVAELDDKKGLKKPVIIIDQSYHLSYPFIFEHQNDFFMIPESSANRTVELYRCQTFPYKWTFEKVLINDINAADITVFYYKNKWWIFANVVENDGASPLDELFLFFTEDLFKGKWISHPQNPIISDVSSSRPAGKLFEYNGKIYRPSQNSSHHYGYGIKINVIETLSEDEYRERCVSEIEPHWDNKLLGTHTLNIDGELTVIDALRSRWRFF